MQPNTPVASNNKNNSRTMLTHTLPQFLITAGKAVKKLCRQSLRYMKFGTRNYEKCISVTNVDFKIIINPGKNGCVDESIALQGKWEPEMSHKLAQYITPGDTFVDIGANIGYHTLFSASLLKNTGKVIAFEPIKRLAQQIEESVAANQFDNVEVYQNGLGDKAAELDLYVRDENMGGSSLSKYENLNLVSASSVETISIKTLDSLLPAETRINVMKIDVEGHEFEALKGAENLLREQKPVIFMEFSPIFYKLDYPGKASELITFLESFGYSFETMTGFPINLKQWLIDTENPTQVDVICK